MGLLDFKNTLQQVKKDLLDKPKEVLLNQAKRELLGEKEINQPDVLVTFEEEKSFQSGGYKRITRYFQALRYGKDVYGMECNPCCVMYFLQNYGLIPPNISRKQFEYAFTPLNPDKKTQNTQAKQKRKDYSGIYLDNNLIIPKEDLFDKSTQTFGGVDFWVYPADDPLYGNTKIFVPKQELSDLSTMAALIDDTNNLDKYLIFPNCAIGV
jgi:hypothetical protein